MLNRINYFLHFVHLICHFHVVVHIVKEYGQMTVSLAAVK